MQLPLIILMARWPATGRCKKRLSNGIGAYSAAKIQKHLIAHTISVAQKLVEQGLIDLKISIEGIGPKRAYKFGKTIGVRSISTQSIGGLGTRLSTEVIKAQRSKNSTRQRPKRIIILMGTDLPTLCELDILLAIKSLKSNDLVIGPAKDGGYWLIGFSEKIVNKRTNLPFDGIRWGSNSVLEDTIKKVDTKAIKYELLTYKNDLDYIEDLSPWYK